MLIEALKEFTSLSSTFIKLHIHQAPYLLFERILI